MLIEEWKAKGQFIDYRGQRVFVVSEGQGTVLLALHGLPTSSWDWYKIWDQLSSSFTLVAFDFMGFGYSDKPRNYAYSLVDQADLTAHLAGSLGLKEVYLLAHDYGVAVAQELLARQNEKSLAFAIKKVILLNGGLFPGVHRPRLIQKLLETPLGPLLSRLYRKKNLERTFIQIFGKASPPSAEEIDNFWRLINHNQGRKVVHLLMRYMSERVTHKERWLSALQQSVCPIQLINGADDPISGRHLVDHYRQVIPDPDCIVLDGVGHYPQVEAPDQVVMHLSAYFKG